MGASGAFTFYALALWRLRLCAGEICIPDLLGKKVVF
jgi:hypothetical protein